MKKRIFAASMASVMALSSVSVVAFADETKADFGETVTKAELKEAIKQYDDTLKNIDSYGSTQALRFQEAYDHAAYVVSTDSDETAATAAYQMLKAVADTLVQYTNAQLKELIEDCKDTYDRNNILNEEIMDNIYKEEAFLKFKNAYEDAESVVDVDDLMLVTDAYIALDEANKNLENNKLTPVLKTEYRAIIKEYESMLAQFGKTETWRRGTVSVNPTTGGAADEKLYLKDAKYVTWGELQEIVNGTSISKVVKKVNPVDSGKAADDTTIDVSADSVTWIAVGGTGNTVEELIYEQSKVFDDYKAASKTTDATIKSGYEAAKEAIAVFKSWKAIDADSTVKSQATKTLNEYRNQLANDFEKTLIKSVAAAITFTDSTGSVPALNYVDNKLVGQAGAAKAGCVLRIVSGTNLIQLDSSGDYEPAEVSGTKSYTIKIAEGVDYMKYIPVRSTNVVAGATAGITADSTSGKVAKVQAALAMLEEYNKLSANSATTAAEWEAAFGDDTSSVDDVFDLDENGTVTKPAGTAREYTFINRYLAYALQDLYPKQSAPCSHTKADIKKIIDAAYDLINETGDSNIFADANAQLATARKEAVEWVREAEKDKQYKDNDDDHGMFQLGDPSTTNLKKATEVYHTLSDATGAKYDALASLLKKYPISYGEIAEKIATVNADFEDGAYSKAVKTAIDKVAYALSVLKVTDLGNEAFDDERAFNGYNRLYVNNDATEEEKNLKKALDALDKAIEDATKAEDPDVVLGDADGDKVLTPKDAAQILKAYAQLVTLTDAQKKAADFNKDGNVDAKDALAILKSLAGIKE